VPHGERRRAYAAEEAWIEGRCRQQARALDRLFAGRLSRLRPDMEQAGRVAAWEATARAAGRALLTAAIRDGMLQLLRSEFGEHWRGGRRVSLRMPVTFSLDACREEPDGAAAGVLRDVEALCALGALSAHQAAAVRAVFLAGGTMREHAEGRGVSIKTVESDLRRARRTLRRLWPH
jgi:DNA-directed RNA polymerase specialized sigma24 family protein